MAQSASVVSTEDKDKYKEAERACVGAVLGASNLWNKAVEMLRPLDFAHPPAYVMFDALDAELDRRVTNPSLGGGQLGGPISYPELLLYPQHDPRVNLEKWRVNPLEFRRCLNAASEAGCLEASLNDRHVLSQGAIVSFEESARTVLDGRLRRELVAAGDDIQSAVRSDVDPSPSPRQALALINQRCNDVRDIAGRLDRIGSIGRWPYQKILATQPIFPAADVRPAAAVTSFGTEIAEELRRLAQLPADHRRSRLKGVLAVSNAVQGFQDRLERVAAEPSVRRLRERVNQVAAERRRPSGGQTR